MNEGLEKTDGWRDGAGATAGVLPWPVLIFVPSGDALPVPLCQVLQALRDEALMV